ncbi:hypothetical protein [Roseateles toxinivorans]|uniref:Uncharacterized protein n=1 Tax=Roseateles toxinivorans TaxID=270368 RepID=A0A4R6QR51_9BURK|nr:hypothetical protein [Roseateles toxinivorans]TDP74050.1 hypothetical protein DES47_10197 [Roseateles toxinivorans]
MRIIIIMIALLYYSTAGAQILCESKSNPKSSDARANPAFAAICSNPSLRQENDEITALRDQVISLGLPIGKYTSTMNIYRIELGRCKDVTCIQALQSQRKELLASTLDGRQGKLVSDLFEQAKNGNDELLKALLLTRIPRTEQAMAYKSMLGLIEDLKNSGGSSKIESEHLEWVKRAYSICSSPREECSKESFKDRLQTLRSQISNHQQNIKEEKSYASAEKFECNFSSNGKPRSNFLRINTDGTALMVELGGSPSQITTRYFGKYVATGNQFTVTFNRTQLLSNDETTQLQLDGNLPGVPLNDGRLDAAMNEHKLVLSRANNGLRGQYVYDSRKRGRFEMSIQCAPSKE